MELEDSVAVAKALADRSRLLILNRLRDGPLCSDELATGLGLAPSTVSFHVKKLVEAGLIAVRREPYYAYWELRPDRMHLALADLVDFAGLPAPIDVRGDSHEETRVGRAFFSGGRLLRMPVQRRKRHLVLEHFASLFKQGRDYEEREVDALIEPVFGDYCLVRRMLVDEGYLERAAGIYRRTDRPASARLATGDEEGTKNMAAVDEKKRLKEEYKTKKRIAGVFAVTNTVEGKVFLGSCLDAERPLRRILFELKLGSFRNRGLQADFGRLGEKAFHFSVLETVDAAAEHPERELEQLELKHLAALDWSSAYNTDPRIRFR